MFDYIQEIEPKKLNSIQAGISIDFHLPTSILNTDGLTIRMTISVRI